MIAKAFVFTVLAVTALHSTNGLPRKVALSVDDCPFGLNRDNYLTIFGHLCYTFEFNTNANFKDAQEHCKRNYGNLVTIKTKKINDFITGKLKFTYKENHNPVWIGIKKDAADNTLKWTDSSSVSYNNFRNGGQTNGGQCGALMPQDGTWVTLDCKAGATTPHKISFVCEYPAFPKLMTTLPSIKKDACPVVDSNPRSHTVFQNKCYYFNLGQKLTFDDAESFCEKHGGRLALVKTKVIENFLQHELHTTHQLGFFSPSLWIGLRYVFARGGFYWVDNTLVDYNNFEYEDGTGECIALLPWSGGWEDLHCHNKAPYVNPKRQFICEFEENATTSSVNKM